MSRRRDIVTNASRPTWKAGTGAFSCSARARLDLPALVGPCSTMASDLLFGASVKVHLHGHDPERGIGGERTSIPSRLKAGTTIEGNGRGLMDRRPQAKAVQAPLARP